MPIPNPRSACVGACYRGLVRGGIRPNAQSTRWASNLIAMFDGRFRAPVERAVKPIGDGLRRTGLTPDHLTLAGLVLAVAAAIVIASGGLRGGLVLGVLAALPDLLDGALAKASNNASQRGAFFDSVADRVTDMLLFGGVAWYLAS